jgi:hypothetical protein
VFRSTGHSNIKCRGKAHYNSMEGLDMPILKLKNIGQALFGIIMKTG